MDAPRQVAALYAAYQERDWPLAARYLHPEAVVDMPATAERLAGRDGVLGFQRAYPEPWGDLSVLRVLGDATECAAEVQVLAPDGRHFRMAAFWRQADGLLREGVEYWVTVGGDTPEPGRMTAFAAGQDDRSA